MLQPWQSDYWELDCSLTSLLLSGRYGKYKPSQGVEKLSPQAYKSNFLNQIHLCIKWTKNLKQNDNTLMDSNCLNLNTLNNDNKIS